ncbi:YitT family protein [Hoeflea sp.]|uniref:YitT family protein n=1 Tax=Hoeflea sp. TaxID=1940281 RepID=UPI003B52E09D
MRTISWFALAPETSNGQPVKKLISFHDVQGIAFGILMTSLGVVFLKAAGLVTGQTAGLALLVSYVLPFGFGTVFLAVSIPFVILSWFRKGPAFTTRTVCSVAGISFAVPLIASHLVFASIPPLLAAILAGACSGVGLIALFRHNSSAGGLGILALIIEQKTGFKTGWFQLCFDFCVFLVASLVLEPAQLFHSLVGAIVLNLIIAWNFTIDQSRRSG